MTSHGNTSIPFDIYIIFFSRKGTPQAFTNSLDSGFGSQPMEVDPPPPAVETSYATTPVIEKNSSQACKRPFTPPSTSPRDGKLCRTSENGKVC